ncbi:hypothetical protein ACPXB3_21510 [Gordonia sp. DT219]|uniref:hypothetical protein n=1 Tax=Gordonia sp. DT219 TaxID=3416658 RepID=UPI003CEBE7F4
MSLDVAELVARIRLDTGNTESGLNNVRRSMSSTAQSADQMQNKVAAAAASQEAASKRQELAEERLESAMRRGNASRQELMRLEAAAASSRASMLRSTSSLAQAQQALAESQSAVQDSMGDSTDALGGASEAADKARDALEKIGIGFSIAGVVEGMRQAVFAASDLAESTNAVDVMFGSASQRVQDWAANAAQSMGQSNVEAREGAVTMALYGKQAGMTGDNLANFSMKMSGLASDMASFRNTTPEQAVEALGAAFRGESDPIEAYGVLLNETTLKNQALKDGLISNTSDALSPAVRVQAVYNAVLAQTSMMQGDFARTQDSLANKLRSLKSEFTNTSAAIGGKLMPIAQGFVDLLSGPGMAAFSGVGTALGSIANVVGALVGAFGNLPGPIQLAIGAIAAMRIATRLFGSQISTVGQHMAFARASFSNFGQTVSNVQRAATITGNSMGTIRASMVTLGRTAATSNGALGQMAAAFYRSRQAASVMPNTIGAVGAAMSGLGAGARGLMGALGGPWGLAITGAVALLGLWINKKQQDKQASQEAAAQTSSWADQIDQAGGKITRALRNDVFKEADNDAKKFDTTGKTLADTMKDLGFSSEQTVDAIVRQGDAYDTTMKKLQEIRNNRDLDIDKRIAADEAIDRIRGMAGQMDEARSKAQQLAEANGDMSVSFDNTAQAAGAMSQAMADFEESTDGAASKVDKLAKALDQLNDDGMTQEEALQQWNDGIRDLVDAYGKFDASLIGVDGHINTATEAGSKMQDTVRSQAQAFNETAAAAYEYAQSQGMTVAQSLDYVRGKLIAQRQQFLDTAVAAGVPIDAARRMADAYRLIPDQVTTELNVHGTENAISGLQKLGMAATSLPPGNLKVIDNTPEVRAKLDEMRVKYSVIDGKVVIDSNSPEVTAAMEKLGVRVTTLPNGYVQLDDNSPAVVDKLKSLGIRVQTLPNGKIVISPEDRAFWEAVRKAQEPGRKVINIVENRSSTPITENTGHGGSAWDHAAGGLIHGPGTGTSDDVPANLSNGEFVQTAAATSYYGPGFMYALNRRQIPKGMLPGFAEGGLVEVHKLADYATGVEGGTYALGGWGNGWNTDCSGAQAIVANGAHGNMQPGAGERAGTAAFSSFLPSLGYVIGQAPPGVAAHEVGWSPEHSAGTFFAKSGASVNFEMGGGMDTTSHSDGKFGGTVGSRHAQFPSQAWIALPDTKNAGGGGGGSTPAPDVVLTRDSSRDDVAKKIIQEGRRRGYSDEQTSAILSMAIQEDNLQTDNVFQQMDSSVYPGRDDPNTNITGFYDALDAKKSSSGWSDDIWSDLFWVQQSPSASSAEDAVANGRQGYLDEIKAHQEEAGGLVSKLGPQVVVNVTNNGSEFPSGSGDGSGDEDKTPETPAEPPEDPTLFEFTLKNPFEPFWWKGEKEQRQHIIDEYKKQQAWDEYLKGGAKGSGDTADLANKVNEQKRKVQEAEDALKLAKQKQSELKESSTESQRTAAANAVTKATNDVTKAREDLASAEAKLKEAQGKTPTASSTPSSPNVTSPGMRKFANGGTVPGVGNTDSEIIAAMPGEEIIRKAIAQKPGVRSFLKRLNAGQLAAFADGGTVGFGGYSDDDDDSMKPKNWYDWAGLAVGAGFAGYNTIDPYVQMGMSGQVDLGNATPKLSTNTTDTSYMSGLVSDVGGQISQQLQELIWAVKEGKDIRVVIQSDNKPQGFNEPGLSAMQRGI